MFFTKSLATAEKQRVGYACPSNLANCSCNSLNSADADMLYNYIEKLQVSRIRPTYVADEAF